MAVQEGIRLPANWDEVVTNATPVDEGPWNVRVVKANSVHGELRVQYEVVDAGPFQGRILFREYTTRSDQSTATLKELCEAAHIAVSGDTLDPDAFIDKTLRVYVKHNESADGRVFANVVRHWPAEQEA